MSCTSLLGEEESVEFRWGASQGQHRPMFCWSTTGGKESKLPEGKTRWPCRLAQRDSQRALSCQNRTPPCRASQDERCSLRSHK